MKISKYKDVIKTLATTPLLFVVLAASIVALPGNAQALTRVQECQSMQSQPAIQECLNKVNAEAWNNCISRPEAERGACAEEYKNGTAPPEKPEDNTTASLDTGGKAGTCGGGADAVKTMINIGCRGQGNPILDMTFAIIRVLSIGVGIVVIGSFIVAGIQYITSAGDPGATAKAIERIRNTFFALLLYIFAYAILNWLVPAGLLQ